MKSRMIRLFIMFVLVLVSSCTEQEKPDLQPFGPTISAKEREDSRLQFDTARRLVYGLKENDQEQLLGISASSAKQLIDKWLSDHEPVHCKLETWDDSLGMISSYYDQNVWTGRVGYDGACPDQQLGKVSYSLTFEEITMEKVNGLWYVVKWKNVVENWQ